MNEAASVMNSLRRLVHGLRVFDRAAERSAGLSGAQLFVLSRLNAGGAASMNEMADRTCTHQSSVSVVVTRLVDHGFARRVTSDQDRRQVRLTITPAGRRILKEAPEAAQDKLIAAVGRLAQPDRLNLARMLEQLVAAAGLSQSPAALFFEDHSHGNRNNNPEKKRKPKSHAR